jgi:homoserine kinase
MMKESTIKIKAPATVANLVCGFDILGLALNEPEDIMEITTEG